MAAGQEIVFPAVPAVIGGGRIVPSPSSFYLTGEERLRITSANSLAGVSLKVQARIANRQGETVPQSWDHTPNSNRTTKRDDFELGVGSLLNVTVFAGAGAPLIGQTYVIVQLVRGFGTAAIVMGTLLGGYVTATQALGFPGSPIQSSLDGGGSIRLITGTQPGIGAEISEVVPTGARWRLMTITVNLACSAAAGTRQPAIVFRSPGTLIVSAPNPGTVAPSGTSNFFWTPGLIYIAAIGAFAGVGALPLDLQLLGGQLIGTVTASLAAGDQYLAPVYEVREWLEVAA